MAAIPNYDFSEPVADNPNLVGTEQLREVNDLQYMALTMVINSVPVPPYEFKTERKHERKKDGRSPRKTGVARSKSTASKIRKQRPIQSMGLSSRKRK